MALKYMSEGVNLLLTLTVVLVFVISTASTKQCTSKKTERDGYVIKNIGIKLCQLKCAEHGQCASISCDIVTLTCHLSKDESKVGKKEGHVILQRSHSDVPTDSCTSGMCNFGQRCLKTRSGRDVCVQASTNPKPNSVPPATMTTQDSSPHVSASTSDASEGLTPCKTVPAAPVTTQDSDPHATQSPAERRLFSASRDGDLERVKQILAAGHVNINTRGRWRRTPVMEAARWGHKDVVELLVCRGADLSLVADYGYNTLHMACLEKGDLETVKLILSLNVVDINAKNFNRVTAVAIARRKRRQRLVDLLVSWGAH